ncbi:hypothetical protein MBLNU457_g0032t2 [Dothideomycetes sp. NU457]
MSPRTTPKSLSFAPQAEVISPLMLGNMKDVDDLDLDRLSSHRRPKVKGPVSKRLSGRPSTSSSYTSLQSFPAEGNDTTESEATSSQVGQHHVDSGLLSQISNWLRDEKHKHEARRTKRKMKANGAQKTSTWPHIDGSNPPKDLVDDQEDDEVDFSKLEQIIKDFLPSRPSSSSSSRRPSTILRRRPSVRALKRASYTSLGASDTEYSDGDVLVPSAEAVLDNSKTLSYNGGSAPSMDDLSLTRTLTSSQESWSRFKFEIVRLTHTLRLKGWRRVPMDMSNEIEVSRLSGALTNAVYVVSPPQELPQPDTTDEKPAPKRKPPKLLLRIYGPQVEHLIDREAELQILKRLARKKIGPRMLGTFSNGRFEEYFHASPLTPEDLRNSGTSRQIAKRMRELHDGIELLDKERDDGPFVWRNWDKWVQRVEEIVLWLDDQVKKEQPGDACTAKSSRAYICGTEWNVFNKVVQEYRKWLLKQAGGPQRQRNQLVFAHNDTQYGNILRVLPSGTSPLLLPANTHKQLIVIDFEYANANTPGLEFANHFTEWCYNYHDANAPWRINIAHYPNAEEQDRFIRAYVRHRPEFNVQTPKMTPLQTLPEERPHNHSRTVSRDNQGQSGDSRTGERRPGPMQSISNFVHDARGPPSSGATTPGFTTLPPPSINEPNETSEAEETEVAALLKQTRVWRMANTAQWVAWGIVQAKIPGMPLHEELVTPSIELPDGVDDGMKDLSLNGHTTQNAAEAEQDAEEEAAEEEFDYLSYARDRAMFFWGDAVKLGFVKLEELPADVRRDIKIVDY